MPSTSKKQHNFMNAVAHSPEFAKKVGVPQSVGKDFSTADKGRKFSKGGNMANTSRMNRLEELGRVNAEKAFTPKGKKNLAAEKKRVVGELKMAKGGEMKESKAMVKKEIGFMKKAGAPKSMIKHEMSEAKMAKGGIATSLKAHAAAPASKAHAGMKAGGMTKMGSVRTAAPSRDGVATKGKTQGTMIKMARGGRAY